MINFEQLIEVKNKFENEFLRRPGVTGVGVGFKLTKGRLTGEGAIIVFVSKKSDVPAAERIPATISDIKTDVIEANFESFVLRTPVGQKPYGGSEERTCA